MKQLIKSSDLCVKETGTSRGKGVFAQRGFSDGETVEVAPVLIMKIDYDALPELLKTYVFDWATLTGAPGRQALVLGYGSMYNHDNPANLRYEADAREGVMRYVAARTIQPNEELTINYNAAGGVPSWDDDNWFERVGIDLIREPGHEA